MTYKITKDCLVLFKKKPAKVLAAGEKVEISISGGDSKSVRPKDVEVIHPGPVSSPNVAAPEKAEIEETLEMLDGETVAFEDFTALLYGDFTPAAAWGAWSLLDEGTYFTGTQESGVTAKSRAEIDAVLQAAAEKDQAKQRRAAFIERVREGKLLSEDAVYMRDVENVALGRAESSSVMRDLQMEQTPEKAHRLLLGTGLWDCWTDPHPSRFSVALEDPDFAVPELPEEERLDLTSLPAYAIDDEGNQDPDDALSFDGELLWVHVADAAALVGPGSEIDVEAMNRGANLYLPEKIVHMLPRGITDKLGLGLSEKSPALSFGLRIGEDGAPKLEKLALTWLKVTRLSYEEAEEKMDEEPFCSINALAERFRRRRLDAGAVQIVLPEVKIRVADHQVDIKLLPDLASREMVADAMMAAGEAVAAFALEKDIPMTFATQPPPDEAFELPETVAGMFSARKMFNPSQVQLFADRHFGLGLERYVRTTSPLRRYSDLLAHQQLRAWLTGKPVIPAEELSGRIAVAERASGEYRKVERTANEYWKLVYLLENPDWQGRAIAVDKMDDRVTLMIPELAYEFKSRLGSKTELNKEFKLTLNTVDLPGMTARFRID